MIAVNSHARVPLLMLAVVALAAILFLGATNSRANGVPQLVKLEYVPGLSNFGPQDAEGVLEFSFAERYARVDVKNLVPEAGFAYEGWMIAPDGHALSVGTFTIEADGIGLLESRFDGIERYDYDRFVIAAREASEPLGSLPSRLSIAGNFTIIEDAATPGAAPSESRLPGSPGNRPCSAGQSSGPNHHDARRDGGNGRWHHRRPTGAQPEGHE